MKKKLENYQNDREQYLKGIHESERRWAEEQRGVTYACTEALEQSQGRMREELSHEVLRLEKDKTQKLRNETEQFIETHRKESEKEKIVMDNEMDTKVKRFEEEMRLSQDSRSRDRSEAMGAISSFQQKKSEDQLEIAKLKEELRLNRQEK